MRTKTINLFRITCIANVPKLIQAPGAVHFYAAAADGRELSRRLIVDLRQGSCLPTKYEVDFL